MATKSKTPDKARADADQKRSRTISVTDAEWAEIVASADAHGRRPSRHIVMLVRESASA